MKEKICGIYCIENTVDNKKYIGQSIDIKRRFRSHKSNLRNNKHSNTHLQGAWNLYQEDSFIFYVIEECSECDLDHKEQYYIDLYNLMDDKFGYNFESGGSTSKNLSESTRNKMSLLKQNLSEEVRENMSLAQNTIPIYQIDLNGNIINEWRGARTAAKKLNIDQGAIHQCLHHRRRTYYNYIWIFVSEYQDFNIDDYKNNNTQARVVVQLTREGKVVKEWPSANSTGTEGFHCSSVIRCCKSGGKKSHHNYLWMYADDYYKIKNNNTK
jgi:hypothetical protein